MKTINLEEELKERYAEKQFDDKWDIIRKQFSADEMIEFAKYIAQQTLELASENSAEFIDDINGCRECGVNGVDKQSILNIINQII